MSQQMADTTLHLKAQLSERQRTRDTLLTTLLWAIYGYLWLPLISLLAWLIGIDFAVETIETAGGPEHLIDVLTWFGFAMAGLACVITGWSLSQRMRFKDKDRSAGVRMIANDEEMSLWGIDEQTFRHLRNDGCLIIALDESGKIISVREDTT